MCFIERLQNSVNLTGVKSATFPQVESTNVLCRPNDAYRQNRVDNVQASLLTILEIGSLHYHTCTHMGGCAEACV